MHGTVKWYDATRGFGFIAGDDGVDAFLHVYALKRSGLTEPSEGDRLEYDASQDRNGRGLRAENIRLAG